MTGVNIRVQKNALIVQSGSIKGYMAFEALKAILLEALSPAELHVRQSNIRDVESHPDPAKARHFEDEHRKAAFGSIDILLESGTITPEEAERRKAHWDVLHGY